MNWLILVFISALTYAVYQLTLKQMAPGSASFLPVVVIECIAGLVSIAIAAYFFVNKKFNLDFNISYALIAGILLAVGMVANFLALVEGKVALVVSALLAAEVALVAIGGVIIFGEALTLAQIVGILFALISIILLTR